MQVAVVFVDGLLGGNVAGSGLAIAHHDDERIGTHFLGGELVFDVRLRRQKEQLSRAEVKRGKFDRNAGVEPFAPAQSKGGETLAEAERIGRGLRDGVVHVGPRSHS